MPLVTYSKPHPTIHLLTLTSPPDNRLTPEFFAELAVHLDDIEADWRRNGGGEMDPKKRNAHEYKGAGAVVITSGCKGFFSNGLDYPRSSKDPRFFPDVFDPVTYRLMTFPLVTIAAINGHAFAGGFILALACDFRLMTNGRGLLCMNELTFSSPLPNSFSSILSQRIPHPQHLRDTLLARRWTQKEALAMGVLDEIVDDSSDSRSDPTDSATRKQGQDSAKGHGKAEGPTQGQSGLGKLVDRAIELGLKEGLKVGPGSFGAMKDQTYRAYIEASRSDRPILFPKLEAEAFWKRYQGQGGGVKAAREAKL